MIESPALLWQQLRRHARGTAATKWMALAVLLLTFGGLARGGKRLACPPTPSPQASRLWLRHGDPLPDGAVARLGTIRQRVAATSLAFAADGRTLLIVSGGTVGRWDAATGRRREEHSLPAGYPMTDSWLSPGGRLVAVPFAKALAVCDCASGERKHLLPVSALHAAFAPDGRTLATAEYQQPTGRLRLWDLATGRDRLLAEVPSYANDLLFSPDGKRLFAAVDNHSLRCWEIGTGRQVWRNKHWASHLALSPDGRTLCADTYNRGGPLHLWDAATGRPADRDRLDVSGWVTQMVFTPEGRTVVVTAGKDVLVWDVAENKARHRFAGAGQRFALAPDGRTLVTHFGALLRRWDVATGKPLYPDTRGDGHTAALHTLAFTADGRTLATAALDGTVRLWDVARGRPRMLFDNVSDHTTTLAFTPDGKRLLSEAGPSTLRLTDVASGRDARLFHLHDRAGKPVNLGSARLSADGRTLLALSRTPLEIGSTIVLDRKETVTGWEVATGREAFSRTVPCNLPEYSVFSPDGRLLAREGGVRDVATGGQRLVSATGARPGYPFAFSADGRLFAAAAPGIWTGPSNAVHVYELLTGQPVAKLAVPLRWPSALAFSPDGRLLVVAGADALYAWEVATGRRVLHLPARGRLSGWSGGSFACCLAVAPDGATAATGHEDGTVLLWDLAPAWRRLATAAPTAAEIETCWRDLAGDDPGKACAAIDRLSAAPAPALALLGGRLRPIVIEARWLEERLADLDSPTFAVREKAAHELEAVSEAVESQLRQAMEKASSVEVRLRLRNILATARATVPPAETVRRLRSVAVLERIGSPEARALLRSLAGGAPAARQTAAAKDALARLAVRSGP